MDSFSPFPVDLHQQYLFKAQNDTKSWEYFLTAHKRISGAYWTLTSIDLLHGLEKTDENAIVSWILSCQHESGGFGGNVDQDPNLLSTLSAVQCLALYRRLHELNQEKIVSYVASLQLSDGSFMGDIWGEVDSRFTYAAILCLSILQRLDAVRVDKAVEFILSCLNFDGGFGCIPGAESHSGQVFCCIGTLYLTDSLHRIDQELTGWWLAERQLKNGGLNGRPDKKADVCYSWWVLSSLVMLNKLDWIDSSKLIEFILRSQDLENGGIADYPGDRSDVFHTFFGLAGLSLLGCPQLKKIHPAYALPVEIISRE
ncbi:hypothetical protein GpartN1_g6424.t1 [Galdieria partita]|uniref:Geranylgeranyl transferase type-2 subunit beta n=1 Tax=Galdieria partita TaxID=83374 RepID=A0A9C7UT89_9RHOD|nr:hypothetical protein GpartN1_g6424.t1 [Galdieria partita]